jgi:hypothetical protein
MKNQKIINDKIIRLFNWYGEGTPYEPSFSPRGRRRPLAIPVE